MAYIETVMAPPLMLLSQQEVAQGIHQTETVPQYVKPHTNTKQNQKLSPNLKKFHHWLSQYVLLLNVGEKQQQTTNMSLICPFSSFIFSM